MKTLFLFLIVVVSLLAQPFSAGVKAGVPLTDFLSTVNNISTSVPNRYIVGVTGELHLPLGLAVELDALYRHLNYQAQISTGLTGTIITDRTTASSWEFPLLVKYRFPAPIARPFVDAGIAWDTLSGITDTFSAIGANPLGSASPLKNNTTRGFVMGAGVNIHAIVLHISPEIRYTRWTSQHFNLNGVIQSNQNQAEFLVGFTF